MATYPVSPPLPGADAKRRLPTLIESFSPGGYLYVGLANVSPPQTLSLLAVIEERPVAGFEEDADAPVWSFLTGGGWSPDIPLPDSADGTFGFQKTGLIRLTLPAGMSDGTPFMPAGFFWVRAHAKQPGRAGRVLRLVPQAGSATWQIPDDASPAVIEAHLQRRCPRRASGPSCHRIRSSGSWSTRSRPLADARRRLAIRFWCG